MYVKSMVLDGFKSYGKRIEINGFDKEFNAITGLNGSGKSNILDAICFVLGLTNLSQVRAGSLQDLVYKCGQAGITKATVTITFDNRDRGSSPMGYENLDEITIARQVVIGGKNKYMINGSNVPNKRVHDMFCSVQLNVNNPHFLIMQGRITKVLNMKPPEILSLIEEAAGTSMYEVKKQAAYKTIEKKDAKLKEINAIVQEELAPKLRKLKEERSRFTEFQRVEQELQHCRRIHVAWKYVSALESSANAENEVEKTKNAMEEMQKKIENGEAEILHIAKQIEEISRQREAEQGSKPGQIEHDLKTVEKEERKLTAETNSDIERLKAEETLMKQLRKNIADDEAALETKAKELENVGELFKNLRERSEKDLQELVRTQERYHKISDGLLLSETGENATLEQQLIEANQNASKAKTEIQQCEMTMKHSKEQLSKKQKEMQGTANDYQKDSKNLENMETELKNIDKKIKNLDYRDEMLEDLQGQAQQLSKDIRILRDKIDRIESQYPRLRFHYQNPEPRFNRESVNGLVCKLITVEEKKAAYALEVAAGERLYNVIVDNEITSKKLLQNGQLQHRVTIIPLNKINGRSIRQQTIDVAQRLVGKENVQPALSLITFPSELQPAMTWIFGQIFICKDMETAKKVTFHDKIMTKSVTLDGDVFDPTGTLSGGAKSKSGSILLQLIELKATENELRAKEKTLARVNQEISNNSEKAKKYHELKRCFDSCNYEVSLVRQRLQLTSHHKLQEEVNEFQTTIEKLTRTLEAARILERENVQRAAKIEGQLKNATKIREQQLKATEMEMQEKQRISKKSRELWENHERKSETLHLELKELQKMIETGKEDLIKTEEKFAAMKETADQNLESLKVLRARVRELQDELKAQKELINLKNKEIQRLRNREEDIKKAEVELKLEIQKLKHEIAEIQSKAADCVGRVKDLLRKYDWIEQDKAYFGEPGGMYDFNVNKPDEMSKKLQQLEQSHQKLSRNIDARSMSLLDKQEEQYNALMKKKTIVENDRKKILDVINQLDQKKKDILLRAWQQVNRDFGSIFSSLLPGASAKLQPPENQTVLDGLEVKIGFSGIWKESLGELSGGQRSLVALSLILAMLLFKPAPLYILDEVDAALDLSHTQNIGTMLKQHFKRSQFIIVSLKDGMFNNANVLFRTKFVDGFSTISRTTNTNKQRE